MSSRSPLGLILRNRRLDRRCDPSLCRQPSSPSLPLSTCNTASIPSSEWQLRGTALPQALRLWGQLVVWTSMGEHGSERLRISVPGLWVTPTTFNVITCTVCLVTSEFWCIESKLWVLRFAFSLIALPSVSCCREMEPDSSPDSWLNIQFFQSAESRCQRRTLILTWRCSQNHTYKQEILQQVR